MSSDYSSPYVQPISHSTPVLAGNPSEQSSPAAADSLLDVCLDTINEIGKELLEEKSKTKDLGNKAFFLMLNPFGLGVLIGYGLLTLAIFVSEIASKSFEKMFPESPDSQEPRHATLLENRSSSFNLISIENGINTESDIKINKKENNDFMPVPSVKINLGNGVVGVVKTEVQLDTPGLFPPLTQDIYCMSLFIDEKMVATLTYSRGSYEKSKGEEHYSIYCPKENQHESDVSVEVDCGRKRYEKALFNHLCKVIIDEREGKLVINGYHCDYSDELFRSLCESEQTQMLYNVTVIPLNDGMVFYFNKKEGKLGRLILIDSSGLELKDYFSSIGGIKFLKKYIRLYPEDCVEFRKKCSKVVLREGFTYLNRDISSKNKEIYSSEFNSLFNAIFNTILDIREVKETDFDEKK